MTETVPEPGADDLSWPSSGRTLQAPGFDYRVLRYSSAALVELTWPEGHELFFVVGGERSLGIMAFDDSDPTHGEPRVHLIPKPYQWSLDVSDEELLLLVWLTLGEHR